MEEFKDRYNYYLDIVNAALDKYTAKNNCRHIALLNKAMRYSLFAGGKRVRPVLALAVCEMFDKNINDVVPYACAIEMIHTFSLIHDDLPCMDNDDYRRGNLTNHKVFGEATALLAGDGLLNFAFEIMIEDVLLSQNSINRKTKAIQIIVSSSGINGMIGGQVIDLHCEENIPDSSTLETMHKMKTGALIKAPIIAAATICGADENALKCLEKYSENIGLAFQIKDDIMDVEGNSALMGKNAGSDEANNKSTFVSIHGMEKSKQMVQKLTEESIELLQEFGDKNNFLIHLTNELSNRVK